MPNSIIFLCFRFTQGKGEVLLTTTFSILKWMIQFTQYRLKILLDICFRLYICMCSHSIELKIHLQHFLNFLTEHVSYFISPSIFCSVFIATIKSDNKQEVYIIMSQQEGVAVKKAVFKLAAQMIWFLVCRKMNIILWNKLFLTGTYEEVWNYIVPLGQVIPQFRDCR